MVQKTKYAIMTLMGESKVKETEKITEKGMQNTARNKLDLPKYIATLSLFVAFSFGIFAPSEFYFTNINDVWFDIYDVILLFIAIFAATFIALFVLLYLLFNIFKKHAGIIKVILAVVSVISICIYIQGNFLQASYDKIGGEKIDWSMYTVEGISNVLGWAGMILLFSAVWYKLKTDKFMRFTSYAMIFLLLIEVSTLVAVGIMKHGLLRKNEYVSTVENQWELSKGENYITLVLDTFDARVFDEIISENDYTDTLSDFTYFRNTLTVYTLTDFSIPQVLTGEKYLNQENYGAYIERAYADSPFLNRLHDDGYRMDIYSTVTLPQAGAREWMSNWHKVDYVAKDSLKLLGEYYKMLAFRYMPHYLKAPFECDIDDFNGLSKVGMMDDHEWDEGVDPDVFPWGNKEFVDDMNKMNASYSGKDYHLYHIKGLHAVRDLDENLNEVKDIKADEDGVSLEESARANMLIIKRFLDKLKELGIYDDSVVVIMADHGAAAYEGGGKIQSPLLLVKGRNEKHPFETSEAPVSYEDMQEGFINLLDGRTGTDIFAVKEGDTRTRVMYYTDFERQQRRFTKSCPFIEYETTAHAFEGYRLTKTGREF